MLDNPANTLPLRASTKPTNLKMKNFRKNLLSSSSEKRASQHCWLAIRQPVLPTSWLSRRNTAQTSFECFFKSRFKSLPSLPLVMGTGAGRARFDLALSPKYPEKIFEFTIKISFRNFPQLTLVEILYVLNFIILKFYYLLYKNYFLFYQTK